MAHLLAVLDQCEVMRIGLCQDNKPYIVPMNFAYTVADEKLLLYFHCAPAGKKLDIIAKNHNVCFEADCHFRTIPNEKPCNWSAEFQSIMGEGSITILTGEAQKAAALDLLMKRYGFEGKPDYDPRMLAATTVLQLSVDSMTGKAKVPYIL